MRNYSGLVKDKTTSGAARVRHRATGIRLYGEIGSAQFDREYQAAEAIARGEATKPAPPQGIIPKVKLEPNKPETLNWLVRRWEESPGFAKYKPSTRRDYHNVLTALCASMWRGKERGSLPYALIDSDVIEALRDEKKAVPEGANKRLKCLRALFAWAKAKPRCLIKANPCDGVTKLKPKNNDGFFTATADVITMWEEHFPPGHMARRALELMKCFGTRRGDLYRLGPHMERTYDDGTPYLYVEPEKGSASEFRPASAPLKMEMTPELIEALAAPPPGEANVVRLKAASTYITQANGEPYRKASFGNKVRDWSNEATKAYAAKRGIKDWRSLEVRKATVHSFRKELAGHMLSEGADAGVLLTQFGWTQLKTAQRYIEKFERAKAARRAGKFVRRRA